MKYSYNDISIIPAELTYIEHRGQCNPYVSNKLPIFTAPMSSIVTKKSYKEYMNNNIIGILPRNISLEDRMDYLYTGNWVAMSMSEFNELKLDHDAKEAKVCVDIANGHMAKLYKLVKEKKYQYPNLQIMTGNIANPESYKYAVEAGIDYIRLGIGAGNGCITSSNTGIHYPMASLVAESAKIADEYNHTTKLIADGGIRNYSDVIKALALGADYVMIGSLFATCFDSIDKIYDVNHQLFEYNDARWIIAKQNWKKKRTGLYHKFYGMASKEGQTDLYGEKVKTSEGISKFIPITTTIAQWSSNMKDYLRSAMSYCDSTTLEEFRRKATIITISNNVYHSVNKQD